jgi:hypothetical protein
MATAKLCSICGRPRGSTLDRWGCEDGIPLGPLANCPTCGKTACPDCLHEADCCWEDEDGWIPDGWESIDSRNAHRVSCPGIDSRPFPRVIYLEIQVNRIEEDTYKRN